MSLEHKTENVKQMIQHELVTYLDNPYEYFLPWVAEKIVEYLLTGRHYAISTDMNRYYPFMNLIPGTYYRMDEFETGGDLLLLRNGDMNASGHRSWQQKLEEELYDFIFTSFELYMIEHYTTAPILAYGIQEEPRLAHNESYTKALTHFDLLIYRSGLVPTCADEIIATVKREKMDYLLSIGMTDKNLELRNKTRIKRILHL